MIATTTTMTAMILSCMFGSTALPRPRSPATYTTMAGAKRIVVTMTPCNPHDHTRKMV